jgi:pyruvate formate lyase activating enzyme
MILGGIQKQSFIDYPGKISCVLFTQGCNFHCPYCHNPQLVRTGNDSPLEETRLWDFLKRRTGFIDGVVITGGEPTLQKDLISFCGKIKAMGYSLKLDTNGSRPQVVQELIEKGLVDYIALDIKTDPSFYSPVLCRDSQHFSIRETIRAVLTSSTEHEFRTTCVKPFLDTTIIEGMVPLVSGADLFSFQQLRTKSGMLNPEYMKSTTACQREELEEWGATLSEHVKSIRILWQGGHSVFPRSSSSVRNRPSLFRPSSKS